MMHDTHEMLWNGTYHRTAPLARAEYVTTATSVTITHWNDVYEAQASAANIAVFADGVLVQSFHAPSMGLHTNVVALPAGEKVVEVVTGGMRGPGNDGSDLPTFVGRGIFLSGLEFNASAQQTPIKKHGLLILTDSIGNGSTLDNPAVESYPSLLRRMVDYPVSVLGRGGMALYDVTARVGVQPAFFLPKLEREIARHDPLMLLYTLGYNDANKAQDSRESYRNRWWGLLDKLASEYPQIHVAMTGMTPVVSPPSSLFNNFNTDYFSTAYSGHPTRSSVDWRSGVITTAHLNDNVHPNAEGHLLMANHLASNIPNVDIPPGVTLFGSGDITIPYTSAPRRFRIRDLLIDCYQTGTTYPFNWLTYSSVNLLGQNRNSVGRLFEIRVNGGEWIRLRHDGTIQPYPTIENPPTVNLFEIRRYRGDGRIIASTTVTYADP